MQLCTAAINSVATMVPDVRLFIQPTTVSINNNPISIQENTALLFTLNINPEPLFQSNLLPNPTYDQSMENRTTVVPQYNSNSSVVSMQTPNITQLRQRLL